MRLRGSTRGLRPLLTMTSFLRLPPPPPPSQPFPPPEGRALCSLMTDAEAARSLLSAGAVRERAHEMLAIALDGGLTDWRGDLDRLPATADIVAGVIRQQYPTLEVPFHARWRHFVVGGRDLWGEMAQTADWPDAQAKARAAFDLAITSVLLDAGAGPDWRFLDAPTRPETRRSEGLRVASPRLFPSGALSAGAG